MTTIRQLWAGGCVTDDCVEGRKPCPTPELCQAAKVKRANEAPLLETGEIEMIEPDAWAVICDIVDRWRTVGAVAIIALVTLMVLWRWIDTQHWPRFVAAWVPL